MIIAQPPRSSKAHQRRLEQCYPLPDPLRSWEELQVALHHDLAGAGTAVLVRELYRARHRLMHEVGLAPWLEERVLAIEEELECRRTTPPTPPAHRRVVRLAPVGVRDAR